MIESIHPGAVKAVFANDNIRRSMLLGTENPFTHAYIVDVSVETVRGKPALYRILNVHDKVEKPAGDA